MPIAKLSPECGAGRSNLLLTVARNKAVTDISQPTLPGLARLRALHLPEKTWFNALWFQSTWFLCVLGRETLLPLTLGMIALHFVLAASAVREFRSLLPIATLGIGIDALLSAVGVFDFGPVLLPLWLMALWFAFATTLTRALAVFGRKRWVAAVVGSVGVPFNYVVGAKMGAVALPLSPVVTAVVLVSVWAVLLPVLYRVAGPPASRGAE